MSLADRLGDTLHFRYTVATGTISSSVYTASPALAPRTVSVSRDGGFATLGMRQIPADREAAPGVGMGPDPCPLGRICDRVALN